MTSTPTLEQIKKHVRQRPYMSGVTRELVRIKSTSEVFTPSPLVIKTLDRMNQNIFKDPHSKIGDLYGCGDGQFLGEALIRKVENGIDFETALGSLYGVDIMQDNVDLCKERLLCGQTHLKHIVDKNIICADSSRYHMTFDGTKDASFESLFEEA
jgi:hypothetical protein